VVFHALTLEQIGDIVELQLREVRHRLAERKIALEVTPGSGRAPRHGRLRPGLRRAP